MTDRHRPFPASSSPRPAPQAMWANDATSQRLGMAIERIAPGEATLSMAITDLMLNGHGLAHGGFVFALADSAFAFACNGYNQRTVGAPGVDHLHRPRPSRRPADRAAPARSRARAAAASTTCTSPTSAASRWPSSAATRAP